LTNEASLHGIDSPKDIQYTLKDLSGNIFYAQTGSNDGFMVFDPISYKFTEKSAQLTSPYDFNRKGDYYYFGPMNYYERKGDLFYSLGKNGIVVSLDYITQLQEIFDVQLQETRILKNTDAEKIIQNSTSKSSVIPRAMTKKYINNYQYIRDAKHPTNYDGSCGFVGGTLLLNFWHNTIHNGLIRPEYLDANGDLNDTYHYSPATNLKDKLVEFNGGDTASWGLTVRDALIDYATYANTPATSAYYFGKIGLDNELNNNRPAIIFGALPNHPDSNLIYHAVTAYGTETDWWGGYYIVNYGWGAGSEEVSLGFGFVGSVTFFSLNPNHFISDFSISQSDYGFPQQYHFYPISKTVTKGALSFETNRLRTGFIENEYVVLSPRRANAGTAYLEYIFDNPVYKIEVDMALWSNDERYGYPNVAEARLEYKNLHGNDWHTKIDLLNEANLPTNREMPTTYTFEFPAGTRQFRFYSHFSYMALPTDRNKGRICIGNMVIYTEGNN